MSNEADAIVSAIIAKWCAGFATLDAAALSSLYAKNAFFFGSNPKLYRGRDGVADYFNGLPRWRKPSA
ncbi:nuclear transport factor 2 family protein, partial [Bradyrhizobium ottawaense]